MTPERFDFLMEHFRRRCAHKLSPAAHRQAVAEMLAIDEKTLRRWLNGRVPVPQSVAIVAELMYQFPVFTLPVIQRCLRGGPVADFDTKLSQREAQIKAAAGIADLTRHCFNLRTGLVTYDDDPRFRAALGVAPEAAISHDDWHSHVHPQDIRRHGVLSGRALEGKDGGTYDWRYRLVTPQGQIVRVHSRGQVSFIGNEPFEFVGVSRMLDH